MKNLAETAYEQGEGSMMLVQMAYKINLTTEYRHSPIGMSW
jgi:hypothetical protein